MLAHHKKQSQKSFSPNRLNMAQQDRPLYVPRWSINKLQRQRRDLELRVCVWTASPANMLLYKSVQIRANWRWRILTNHYLHVSVRPPLLLQYQVSTAADSRGPGVKPGSCSDFAEWQRPDDTQPQWQRLGVINHGQWQSDKRCSKADWEEKLLWRVCDGEEALTTCVNKGQHLAEADPNSSLRLNLPWKAITATLLASSRPSPPPSFSSRPRRKSHSAGPRWPSSANSEMSSRIWRWPGLQTEEPVSLRALSPLLVIQAIHWDYSHWTPGLCVGR